MARTIMAVYSNPVSPEREDEFNTWYDEIHLPELMDVPGFVGATRYRLGQVAGEGVAPQQHRYLALYEIEGDPAVAYAELGARAGSMNLSEALDGLGTSLAFWVPITGGSA